MDKATYTKSIFLLDILEQLRLHEIHFFGSLSRKLMGEISETLSGS